MSQLQNILADHATARGYANIEEMKQHMGDAAYSKLCAVIIPKTSQITTESKRIRVYLIMDPTVQVFVNTREDQIRAKLRGIRKDIINQKFPRWAPFAGLPEATGDGKGGKIQKPSWAWEFVDA
jgi:hypothetical protein